MKELYAFLTMRRVPVTLLDVAWAFAWPLLAAGSAVALIIWVLS